MTKKELPARAANIQRAVASTSTCTPAIVESLRSFLLPTVNAVVQPKKPTDKTSSLRTKGTSSRRAGISGARARKQPVVDVLEESGIGNAQDQTQDRAALATEVVNATLKALSEAIRSPFALKKRAPLRRTSSTASFSNGLESRNQTPLQPLSVNRLANTQSGKGHMRRSSSTIPMEGRLAGLRAQAECGRIAFGTLRSIQGLQGSPPIPFLQLELGMSALIGRLITLGFDDLALKEIRILRRRLDAVTGSSVSQKAMEPTLPTIKDDAVEPKTETLVDLLKFRNPNVQGSLLTLMITTQLQILKVLALKQDASTIEAAIQFLRLETPHSPANMIQRQINSKSPDSRDKAAHQLESLAQILIALCPDQRSAEDHRLLKSSNTLAPRAAFELQFLAFQIRSVWWKISGHCVDLAREMIDPFARCLATFHRRSRMDRKEKYIVARGAFDFVIGVSHATAGFREEMLLAVYQVLADMAQESSQYLEASEWVKKSQKSAQLCGVSQTRLCILDCRLASNLIREMSFESSDHVSEPLQAAASSLGGRLQGNPAELDELLTIVANLRKSAFSVVQDAHRQGKMDQMQRCPAHVETCSEIVLLCVRFLLRYVGDDTNRQGDEKTTSRCEQRRALAAQVVYPVIDSVAAMANLSAKVNVDEWSKLDRGLRDCWGLALILESAAVDERSPSTEAKRGPMLPFLTISNVYWYRYMHLKQAGADPNIIRDCLRTSIDILHNGTLRERTVGCLPAKLDRYAQLCETLRDYRKATETYQEAIHAHITNGILSTAAQAAAARSMPNALEADDEGVSLLRMLIAYPRAAIKATGQGYSGVTFYDDPKLCDSQRGVLLEQQLIALSYLFKDQGSSSTMSRTLRALAQKLLRLYTEDKYPVRRLRVILRLHVILSAFPDALDDANRKQVLREPSNVLREPHHDTGLVEYLPHLTACRELSIGMIQGTLSVEKIGKVMKDWLNLLHDHPDWRTLQLHVYDMVEWLSQLESLVSYLGMKGLEMTRISVLHILVTIHEASIALQCSTLVSELSELGLQYSRLGYSGAAGVALRKAERYLSTSNVAVETALRYHIVQAEVAHAGGNLKACSDHVEKARELFHEVFKDTGNQGLRLREQSDFSQSMGDAAYLLSLLAAAEGSSAKALYLARVCVKSYQRAWAIAERSRPRKDVVARTDVGESQTDTVVESLSELSISEHRMVERVTQPHVTQRPCGAAFWCLVPGLSKGLIHLSELFAHHGLLPEVRYYLKQAQRVAETAHAPALIGQHLALLGHYSSRGGDLDKGAQFLQQAVSLLSETPRGLDYVSLQLYCARQYAKQRKWQAMRSALDTGESNTRDLMTRTFADSLIHKQTTLEGLDSQLSTLKLQDIKMTVKPKLNVRNRSTRQKLVTMPDIQQEESHFLVDEIPEIEAIELKRLRGEIQRQRAFAALCEGALENARSLLTEVQSYPCDQRGRVSHALLSSQIRYGQRLEQLVADPVFCVIPESTISHPSVRIGHDPQQQQCTSNAQLKGVNAAPPTKNQRGKPPANRRRPRSPSLCKSEMDALHLAQNEVTGVCKLARKVSSTTSIHQITDVLGKVLLLLSATASSVSKRSVSPAFVVYALEIGRIVSTIRESLAIAVERQLSSTKLVYHWPGDDAFEEYDRMNSIAALEPTTFQSDYIDIIPSSWTAISMTLTESRDELLICKIRAGQSPFVLRLPLSRNNSLESDDGAFGFDQGRAELHEIILSANQSTHAIQDLCQKGAKTQWWEARTALDARLNDLLNNIESIWFGGFKGIFSHKAHNINLLARFQQSLQNILDKHLPSRQKSGRGAQSSRVTLDQSVLELFVGLGNPSESNDLAEPLMDLLYFVVDIMQFNGERNAYDEVDFDAIAIETIDALRHYHQAVEDEDGDNEEQHTILVLDKHLHCFPWESLPCLSGQAVSRLPSLGCLRDRIMHQMKLNNGGSPSSSTGKIFVDRDNGISVLNPAGDLKATQARFEEPLQKLPGWQTIIQQEPTETEMKGFLENRGIFLYFGHGSGGQYIRSRTIKKLEKCAVALLMGCSSGALTEAGEFEPYGTPLTYMHAGSPAILATLWDVTDKDIDKFSNTVLEKWGLFGGATPPVLSKPVKESIKERSKSKVRNIGKETGIKADMISLDEAVAQGRDSCLLKYLNGAAPVVYGVPVFLSL